MNKTHILILIFFLINFSYQSFLDISSLSNIDQIKQTKINFAFDVNFDTKT